MAVNSGTPWLYPALTLGDASSGPPTAAPPAITWNYSAEHDTCADDMPFVIATLSQAQKNRAIALLEQNLLRYRVLLPAGTGAGTAL